MAVRLLLRWMRLLGDNLESLYDKKRAWVLSLPFFIILLKVKSPDIINNTEAFWKRAEDGTRTRDPNLGKVMLYQLSYFRKTCLLKLVYSKRDLNPHSRNGQRILSPSCLPIPPFEHPFLLRDERKTGLEPATLTLARLCSTN